MTDITPHPLEIVPDGEADNIEKVTSIQLDIMKNAQDPHKRGQHPKTQALLRGAFEISGNVPDKMRVGIFSKPRKYEALVRFSTGLNPNDGAPQAHGCAIKLLDVEDSPTGTQDFILIDQPTFFVSNVADYVSLFEAIQGGCPHAFYASHQKEFGLQQSFNVVVSSHVDRQYWEELPIAMGESAGRLTLVPDVTNGFEWPAASSVDGLKDAAVEYFVAQRRSAKYSFAIQPYVDESATPIEDGTAVWGTPFEEVATLTLPAQDFTAPEQYAFGENLSYSPWHCHPEHQPLGGIQRCRKRVYEESQRLRHTLNGVEQKEPTLADLASLGAAFNEAA